MDVFERLSKKYKTPEQVQRFLQYSINYNREENGETLRSATEAIKAGRAHCLESCFIAAAILEHHGYPPMVLSIESKDWVDHVIFIFQQRGRWGGISLSRDRGLHGRKPVYKSIYQLVASYYDPFVDDSGKIIGYQVFHLDETLADWRRGKRNLWNIEQYMNYTWHYPFKSSRARYRRLYKNYMANGPVPHQPEWW